MQWSDATFPVAPREEPSVRTVDGAFLTKVSYGPLRTVEQPRRWIRGAVYNSAGKLVKSSQKIGGLNGVPWAPADPGRVKVRDDAELLHGTWQYGGHWMQHFGHFIIETLTTLWPEPQRDRGLVFHRYLRRDWSIEPWQEHLLDLAGYGDLPIRVVDKDRPLRVERLVVPSRTVVNGGWAHPPAREVWQRMTRRFEGVGGPERLFLSRTRHHALLREQQRKRGPRTSPERDRALDRIFAERGFEVVSPEELGLDEQLRLVANAQVIAGVSGSALHLSAFARTGTRVLEVGDERSFAQPMPLQRVIDTVSGHRTAFVPGRAPADRIAAHLDALDLLAQPSGSRWFDRLRREPG